MIDSVIGDDPPRGLLPIDTKIKLQAQLTQPR